MNLGLTADEVLTTTRSVRKRLDLDRPVERSVVEECLDIALQAPTGSNTPGAHGLPTATATGTLPDDGDTKLQGVRPCVLP